MKALFLVFSLLLSFAVFAQSNAQPQPQKEPSYVDFTGFKGKIFELKNRDPQDLVSIIAPLGSGFKGAVLQPNSEMKTLTVRDFPENIAAIEEALKRLDTPLPSAPEKRKLPRDVELRLHVLLAHNQVEVDTTGKNLAQANEDSYPLELRDVLKQLRATINYKNYQHLTSIVQRAANYARPTGEGVVTIKPPLFEKEISASYQYNATISLNFYTPELPTIQIGNFYFQIQDSGFLGRASLNSQINIREDEKLVVGTANLKDKALVLVLTVKTIK